MWKLVEAPSVDKLEEMVLKLKEEQSALNG
jgi:hypothetical protein